jgi:septal ring factor EnvC (AmiA/AmiB activator)
MISFFDQRILDSVVKDPNTPAGYKLYLYRESREHWLFLLNENPVERTILNIHQVAHYTAEVQTKTASMETMIQDIIRQNQELIAALEALSKENKEMRAEINEIKKERETVITVTHSAPTVTTTVATKNRFTTSELICGNS